KSQIENIYDAGGRVFVEIGPKPVLTGLVKDILKDKKHYAIAFNPNAQRNSDQQFRQAVVQLQVLGLPISNIDIYKRPERKPPVATKLDVKLSGNNYVSEPTHQAYEEALNNNFQIKQAKDQSATQSVNTETFIANKTVETPSVEQNEEEIMNKETLNLLKETIEHFKSQQTKSI